MSDRTGSGLVELAVLEAVGAATAGRPRAYVVCTKVLAAIEESVGLGPRYGYEVLLDLARPWVIPLPMVTIGGNKGDRDFPEPAAPAHTECRLSHAGQLVLDVEAHRLAPIPVGIINGTTYRGGKRPPLEPFRVLAAVRKLLNDPEVPDSDVLAAIGPPYSTTGCDLTGDLTALMTGRPAVVRETARITISGVPVPAAPAEPSAHARPRAAPTAVSYARTGPPPLHHPAHLVIESLPARTSNPEAGQAIISRVRHRTWPNAHPPQARDPELPIEDITDQASNDNGVRIVLALRPGSDPVTVRNQLAAIEGITTEARTSRPALRAWKARSAVISGVTDDRLM